MIPPGNYLLVGRTGVGKSSLVNTIAQASLAAVDNSYASTQAITSYVFSTPAGSYTIYDAPGFCEDDNPATDAEYLSKIKFFLDRKEIDSYGISLLLVVRLDSTRIRSDDHEVVKYLAELLLRFRLPLVLVATWADFTRSDLYVRSQLDLARIQYLAMVDKALLDLTYGNLCAEGFDGAYAVDNESGAWLSSWQPLRQKNKKLLTLESCEAEVGHPVAYISEWISSARCNPRALIRAGKLDLITARIENLTRYPFQQDLLLPDFLDMNISGSLPEIDVREDIPAIDLNQDLQECSAPYLFIDDATLISGIEHSRRSIRNLFRIRSLDGGSIILSRLSESHAQCCTLLRPIVSTRGFSRLMCSHLVSFFAARTVLEGLYICLNRADIEQYHNRSLSGAFLLEERVATFGSLLSSLFSLVGKAYLLDETKAFIEASFFPPRCHQFAQVKKHFMNCMEILYLSVVFAEWALFPRSLEVFKDEYWSIDSEDVLEWMAVSCPLYGYSELVLKVFKSGDWHAIADLAMDCPNCMPSFMEDITRSLSLKPLLVSEGMIRVLGDAHIPSWYVSAEVPF
jgi:GTP-binding protein EngB required for normal cell division